MTYEEVIANFDKKNVTTQEIEQLVDDIIKNLPIKNRQKVREELQSMHVDIPENPTTFQITEGLARSQAYRDRIASIYIDAMNDQKMRKRCLEMLIDVNNLTSKGSSADKRKGEATLKYPAYFIGFESSNAFLTEVEIYKTNMENTFNAFSRQASVLQLQVQLGEYKGNAGNNDNLKTVTTVDWNEV